MKFVRTSLAAALMASACFSHAEPLSLDNQTVTATRTGQSLGANLGAVTRLDQRAIQRLQPTDILDLLRRTPSLSIVNNGGAGKSSTVGIRGSSSDHVLVLIDGVRIGSVTSGSAALHNLPIEQIERIEIVRGPRSSLYGSEAIGGVIQIFTKRGTGGDPKPWMSLTAGSRNHHEGSAGISGGIGRGWYSAAVTSLSTRGIDARPGRGDPDNDGYRELSGNLRAGYRFDNGLELEGHVLESHSHNDFDSGYEANNDSKLKTHSLNARFSPLEPWRVTLQAARSEDKNDTFNGSVFNSRFDTRRDSLGWQNDIELGTDHLLTLGFDHLTDEVSSSTSYSEDRRINNGYYAQYLGQQGVHEWQLSLRHDDNEQFGRYNTGNIAYGLSVTDSLQWVASYGTAFKAPTFNQLYYPGFGNPAIKEETSRNIETGLRGEHDWGNWSVNLFRNEVDDLISSVNLGGGIYLSENVDKAVIKGVEFEIASHWLGWDWRSNLTLQDPANRSARAGQGDLLRRRAEQMFNLDVDRRFGRVGVGANVHAEGRRWDNASNTTDLHGYNTVDLRAEYWFSHAWRLQARISNLFDTDYETAASYQQPGRAGYLTVRYQPL
ncbi:TonB-dependent vitamin B12 receptor [Pseudomonas sp. FME51]|uniref:TonB-dependent vitamin B12 receptor n=1 Tax=Pseudomonas sp. FME51 TaxID=2742609 RepID=UPI001865B4AC|nr:TonB-dependent vitamin B12 receptor [Pseudomonas sp. FME51]